MAATRSRRIPARPVLRLVPRVPRRPDPDLIRHLTEWLAQAQAGEIDGVLFVPRSRDGGWGEPQASGTAVDDFAGNLVALTRASHWLCHHLAKEVAE